MCECVSTLEPSFISRPSSVFPHPGPSSLSAGNVILGKPDSHYLCFLLDSLQVIPLGISNLLLQASGCIHSRWPPLLNTCYCLGGYYHINAAFHFWAKWGHKKVSLNSILLRPHPSFLLCCCPHCHPFLVSLFFSCSLASAIFFCILFHSPTLHPLLQFLRTVWFEVCKRLAGFMLLN